MGHSAGGYNAAMLALDNRWLATTICDLLSEQADQRHQPQAAGPV